MDQRVLEVIALMKSSLHKGWSADRLAERVNLSPSRLHQLFKRETGLPPARYLRLLRMQRARELLETTHLSVKQVMARVGVTDESRKRRELLSLLRRRHAAFAELTTAATDTIVSGMPDNRAISYSPRASA